MSLAESVAGLATARGIDPGDFSATDAGRRTTLYRILRGETRDPRLSTLLELCEMFRVSPDDLLHLAGLLEARPGAATLLDVTLRQAFSEVQSLAEGDKRLLLGAMRGIVAERRPRRGRSPRRERARPAAPAGADQPAP